MSSIIHRVVARVALMVRRIRHESFPRNLTIDDMRLRLRPEMEATTASDEGFWRRLADAFASTRAGHIRTFGGAVGDEYAKRCGRLIERRVAVGGGIVRLPNEINWHREPHSGVEWPKTFVEGLSDYREGSDLVLLWHPNKMGYLVEYSGCYCLTGNERLREIMTELIESWCEQNPYQVGMNWRSPLEIGTRIVSWSIALREAGFPKNVEEPRISRILQSLILQAEYVSENMAVSDLPNNHLIGEAATLYAFAAHWPFLRASDEWKTRCESILVSEIQRQVLSDGVDYENAFNYHMYVLDFYLLFLATRAMEGETPSGVILDGVAALARTLLGVLSPHGRLPRFGDDSISEFFVLKDLSDIERTEFTDEIAFRRLVKPEFCEPLETHSWGDDLLAMTIPVDGGRWFSDSGFSVFRSHASHLAYSAGPEHAGDFRAGHLHSDSGSFELEVRGAPIIVDSGTYLYFKDEAARAHFRGASAHNTLIIDRQDPLESADTFKWKRIPRNHTRFWHIARGSYAVASERWLRDSESRRYKHMRLVMGLSNEVWLVFDDVSRDLTDDIEGEGDCNATVLFHTPFAPDAVELANGVGVRIRCGQDSGTGGRREPMYVSLDGWSTGPYRTEVLTNKNNMITWFSDVYGRLRFGCAIVATVGLRDNARLVHTISLEGIHISPANFADDWTGLGIALGNGDHRRVQVSRDFSVVELDGQAIEDMRHNFTGIGV